MDLGGTIIVYLAGACAFLSILGLSYLYRRIVYGPTNPHFNANLFDDMIVYEPTDVSFPVTLELMNKVAMIDEATLQFLMPCSIQANYTFDKPAYFEIKLISLPFNTSLFIGIAPKTIDSHCVPGKVPNSVGVEISVRNDSATFQSNDTVGLFYQPDKPVTIIHNGHVKGSLPLPNFSQVPTLFASGPCIVHVNFGQSPFVYWFANQGLGLVPLQSPLAQPPNYSNQGKCDLVLPKYTRWSDPKLALSV